MALPDAVIGGRDLDAPAGCCGVRGCCTLNAIGNWEGGTYRINSHGGLQAGEKDSWAYCHIGLEAARRHFRVRQKSIPGGKHEGQSRRNPLPSSLKVAAIVSYQVRPSLWPIITGTVPTWGH